MARRRGVQPAGDSGLFGPDGTNGASSDGVERGYTWTEEWRRICEARSWLAKGYTTRSKVDALVHRIAEKRGKEAGEQLRRDMRAEWRKQRND